MKKGHHIFLCIFAIVTMIIVWLSYIYINKIINASMARTVDEKNIIYTENSGKSREQVLVNSYNDTVISREKMSKLYIPSDKAIVFIEALESLGGKSGATVSISSTETEQADNGKVVSFSAIHSHVEAHGSWENVMRTLKLVETMPFSVNIDRIQLSSSVISNLPKKQKKTEWRIAFDVRAPMLVTK